MLNCKMCVCVCVCVCEIKLNQPTNQPTNQLAKHYDKIISYLPEKIFVTPNTYKNLKIPHQ